MSEYHKIQTVFKRDPETNYKTLVEGAYSIPEFEYLANNKWIFTEKVDGTNIRIYWSPEEGMTIKGRTDRAEVPNFLVESTTGLIDDKLLRSLFSGTVVLYGEGYGPKIQKGGKYKSSHSFVLFDVTVGGWVLNQSNVEDIAKSLGIEHAPVVDYGKLKDAVEIARGGFYSEWGEFYAEGIVAKPRIELYTRAGHRIITKIKCGDFS